MHPGTLKLRRPNLHPQERLQGEQCIPERSQTPQPTAAGTSSRGAVHPGTLRDAPTYIHRKVSKGSSASRNAQRRPNLHPQESRQGEQCLPERSQTSQPTPAGKSSRGAVHPGTLTDAPTYIQRGLSSFCFFAGDNTWKRPAESAETTPRGRAFHWLQGRQAERRPLKCDDQ